MHRRCCQGNRGTPRSDETIEYLLMYTGCGLLDAPDNSRVSRNPDCVDTVIGALAGFVLIVSSHLVLIRIAIGVKNGHKPTVNEMIALLAPHFIKTTDRSVS